MDTTDLTRAFTEATADLTPRPGFATDVVRGAKRRRARRLAGTAMAVVAAVGVTLATTLPQDAPSAPVAAADSLWKLVDRPTKGDLAGDKAYLSKVRSAWLSGVAASPNLAGTPLIGELRIVWAGTTPVGPAAYVAQRGAAEGVALGVVAGSPPVLVSDKAPAYTYSPAFLFGPDDRMLITLDLGEELTWSHWVAQPDGRGERVWKPVPVSDGVGLVHLPEGAPPTADVRQADRTTISLRASRYSLGADRQSKPIPQRTTDWPRDSATGTSPLPSLLAEGSPAPSDWFIEQGFLDPQVKAMVTGYHVVGTLPDGKAVTAFEMVPAEGAGSRFYAVVQEAGGELVTMAGGDPIDLDRPLPARVRLPDSYGWFVAEPGATIETRQGAEGEWQLVGQHAALVAAGVEVRVTKPGKEPQTVTLA